MSFLQILNVIFARCFLLQVGSIAQEIAMQEMILKKEKELDNARRQLIRMRKQKYEKA